MPKTTPKIAQIKAYFKRSFCLIRVGQYLYLI